VSSRTETFTMGVEEEYQIIQPGTYELSSSSGALLPTAQRALGEKVQPELQLSQLEAATPVCRSLQEIRAALVHIRRNWYTRHYGAATEPCANGLPTSATNA